MCYFIVIIIACCIYHCQLIIVIHPPHIHLVSVFCVDCHASLTSSKFDLISLLFSHFFSSVKSHASNVIQKCFISFHRQQPGNQQMALVVLQTALLLHLAGASPTCFPALVVNSPGMILQAQAMLLCIQTRLKKCPACFYLTSLQSVPGFWQTCMPQETIVVLGTKLHVDSF